MPGVFVSHAGADTAKAVDITARLAAADVQVRLDRRDLEPGDSFIRYMEQALSTSDYCLLLWSRAAAQSDWVAMEWESGLYRSVRERRAFLIAARLDDEPLPALLGPRLSVDLFPDFEPGLTTLVNLWRTDRAVEAQTSRPVANTPAIPYGESSRVGKAQVFVTSEAFGITVPFCVSLEAPAGTLLHELVQTFALPKVFDHEGRLGVRFEYALASGDTTLDAARSMREQGVMPQAVLWLETTLVPFAVTAPARGRLRGATLRHGDASDLRALARTHLRSALAVKHLT
jgi:hypothetical protein